MKQQPICNVCKNWMTYKTHQDVVTRLVGSNNFLVGCTVAKKPLVNVSECSHFKKKSKEGLK